MEGVIDHANRCFNGLTIGRKRVVGPANGRLTGLTSGGKCVIGPANGQFSELLQFVIIPVGLILRFSILNHFFVRDFDSLISYEQRVVCIFIMVFHRFPEDGQRSSLKSRRFMNRTAAFTRVTSTIATTWLH